MGTLTFTATATDRAGNSSTLTGTYRAANPCRLASSGWDSTHSRRRQRGTPSAIGDGGGSQGGACGYLVLKFAQMEDPSARETVTL